jgi:hypothetical protein
MNLGAFLSKFIQEMRVPIFIQQPWLEGEAAGTAFA